MSNVDGIRFNFTDKISFIIGLRIGAVIGAFSIPFLLEDEQANESTTVPLDFNETKYSVVLTPARTSYAETQGNQSASAIVRSLLDLSKLESDFEQSLALYSLLENADEAGLERFIS